MSLPGRVAGADGPDLTSRDLTNRDLTSRDDVEQLVRAFYREVAQDELLGPVFAGMAVDWPSHLETLTEFWAWQLLGERGYDGNPLLAHRPVAARFPFGSEHYARWLDLFVATVDAHFAGVVAETAKFRAGKLAHALHRLLDGGTDFAPGHENGEGVGSSRRPVAVVVPAPRRR